MFTVHPKLIPEIDAAAERILCLSPETLIGRAGECVAAHIAARRPIGTAVFFCGPGNNGADGYAAALALAARGFHVHAVDVFGKGQSSAAGKQFLAKYTEAFGKPLTPAEAALLRADIAVDAILGTGATARTGALARLAVRIMSRIPYRVAIDLPFGVDAAYGEVAPHALSVHLTVVLSFMKRGLLSYPARDYCGELVTEELGLQDERIVAAIDGLEQAPDARLLPSLLPSRPANSHKGSFGHALCLVGSKKYRGAASLATLGALRSGLGLLTLCSDAEIIDLLGKRLPEIIYHPISPLDALSAEEEDELIAMSAKANALLIGPGCGCSEGLCRLVLRLLSLSGAPLILDADAINALALRREESRAALKAARRQVLMTPHPLEFSRLSGKTVTDIQAHRMRYAEAFAEEYGVALLLKGAGSIVAAEHKLAVNTTGSTALAKGGSGDVLAGVVTALTAQGASPFAALLAAAYLHGAAGNALARDLSEYGVIPSDLPRQIAMELAALTKEPQAPSPLL